MNRSNPEASTPIDGTCEAEGHSHGRRGVPRIDEAALEAAAGFFRAAGDVSRLRLLTVLREGEWCVSELAQALGEGLSTISQRLKVLRTEGLVARRRDGKHVLYSLADDHVAELIGNALAHASDHAPGANRRRDTHGRDDR